MKLADYGYKVDTSSNENEEFNRMPIPERCEAELGEVFDQAKLTLGCNEYNRLVDNAKKNSLDMDYRFPSHSGEMSTNYLFALGHIKKLEANPAFAFYIDKFYFISNVGVKEELLIEYSKIGMMKLYNNGRSLELWLVGGKVIEFESPEFALDVYVFLTFFIKNLKKRLSPLQKFFLYSEGEYDFENISDCIQMVRSSIIQFKISPLDLALFFRGRDSKGIIANYFLEQARLGDMSQEVAESYYGIINDSTIYKMLINFINYSTKLTPKSNHERLVSDNSLDNSKIYQFYKDLDEHPNVSYFKGYISAVSNDGITLKTLDQEKEFINVDKNYFPKTILSALDSTNDQWANNDKFFDDQHLSVNFCTVNDELRYVLLITTASAEQEAAKKSSADANKAKTLESIKESQAAAMSTRDKVIWDAVRRRAISYYNWLEDAEDYKGGLDGAVTHITKNMADSFMCEVGKIFETMGVPSKFISSHITDFPMPFRPGIDYSSLANVKLPFDVFFDTFVGKYNYIDDKYSNIHSVTPVFSVDSRNVVKYNIAQRYGYSNALKASQTICSTKLDKVNKELARYKLPTLIQLIYGLFRALICPALLGALLILGPQTDSFYIVKIIGCIVGGIMTFVVSPEGFGDFFFAIGRIFGGNKRRKEILADKNKLDDEYKKYPDRIKAAKKWEEDWYREAVRLRKSTK